MIFPSLISWKNLKKIRLMENPTVNRRTHAVLYHQPVRDESYLEIRLGKTLAITLLQGRKATFYSLVLEDLVKLKIVPEFPLRHEEQLPRSHFLICNISVFWFTCTFFYPSL